MKTSEVIDEQMEINDLIDEQMKTSEVIDEQIKTDDIKLETVANKVRLTSSPVDSSVLSLFTKSSFDFVRH